MCLLAYELKDPSQLDMTMSKGILLHQTRMYCWREEEVLIEFKVEIGVNLNHKTKSVSTHEHTEKAHSFAMHKQTHMLLINTLKSKIKEQNINSAEIFFSWNLHLILLHFTFNICAPSTHNTPCPPSLFCLSGKPRFISLVEILDCQSDQLPVSGALHGSSNYNPVQLAWAHVAVGQPL